MFAVASPRRLTAVVLSGLLIGLTLMSLIGCGGKEEVDPYVYDTVRRVMDGDTLSVNFLFEIDCPQFEYVKGDVAMIRNGNLLNFLVGQDLEHNYRNLAGTLLGVQKTFTPQPTHLVLRRIKRNGVIEADSLATPKGYVLPRLLRAGAIGRDQIPGAPLPKIGWKRTELDEAKATYLPEEEGGPEKVIQTGFATFVHRPRHDLELAEGAVPDEKDYAWYVVGDECSLEVKDLTPGAEWMLDLLLDKDLPLIGAFTVLSLEDEYAKRKIEYEGLGHVVGTVKIIWFQYANTFVEGSESS